MYTGKNPSALLSQRLMQEALAKLMKEKPWKSITVKELCEASGVSRQTFYTLFGTKEDILLYQLEHTPEADREAHGSDRTFTLKEICQMYAAFIAKNYSSLRQLLQNDLMGILQAQIYRGMSTCTQSFSGITEEEQAYAADFLAAGLSSLTVRYMRRHAEAEESELAQLSYKILSGKIYHI